MVSPHPCYALYPTQLSQCKISKLRPIGPCYYHVKIYTGTQKVLLSMIFNRCYFKMALDM